MKLGKKIALIAVIAATTSLFAAGVNDISMLVEKINNTTDQNAKSELLKKLDEKIETMDKKDIPKAQEIINSKLKQDKSLKK